MKKKTAKIRTAIQSTLLVASLAVCPLALAGGNEQYDTDEKMKDAWLDGKVETALLVNRHLNNFTIDTDIINGKAKLSGTVNSEVDRELAEEITQGIEGIVAVDNELKVVEASKEKEMSKNQDKERSFGTWYDDATTTAAVKSKLLWNSETSGLDVNVDTYYGVVTLNGTVESSAEKNLIEQIAENTQGVLDVKSKIKIDSSS